MPVLRILLAWTILAGCARDAGASRGEIRDGVSDPTSSAVVGIVDDGTGASCTGTLIAPNLVLTGQHCVAEVVGIPTCADDGRFDPPRAPASFHVTTRPILSLTPSDYRGVVEVVVPPGGDRFCGRDIALLVLGANIASTEASPIDPRLEPPPSLGELYSAVGFGGTGDFGEGAGERRRRDGLTVACVGAGCGSSDPDTEWVGEAGVCPGDSGGPAIDAAGLVFGVASRGAVGCASPVYTAVASYASWLRAEGARAATRGEYAPASWVVGGSTLDAGVALDAAVPTDAATIGDAGSIAADGGSVTPPAGGGCSVAHGPPRCAFALAFAIALAALRRRA